MTEHKNIAAEWSVAYAVSIKRLDTTFMLGLLRLLSWPNLGNMHGDLVDDLRLICALLAKRPMVGFLIARRLRLPVDKTFALLSVMHSRGHIHALGVAPIDVNLNALPTSQAPGLPLLTDTINAEVTNAKVTNAEAKAKSKSLASAKPAKLMSSGDILNQLWRVLNTDMVMSKAAKENTADHTGQMSANKPAGMEVGDVLSQLWQVLNADIDLKRDLKAVPTAKSKASLPNTESTLLDVNGQPIEPDITNEAVDEANANAKATDVMKELWTVLNTDIAFKRQSGATTTLPPSAEKAKEVTEVMAQLWRVLNTEIASKRHSNAKAGVESLSDTTHEANEKLSKLWRILDAEITLKKKPSTYVLSGTVLGVPTEEIFTPSTISSASRVNKADDDTSAEAVSKLSQLWQVLNSEITLAMPPEKPLKAVKRRSKAKRNDASR